MILLVSGIERRRECAGALQEATGEAVEIAENLLQATTRLRTEVYSAVVFDEQLGQGASDEMEAALAHLGTAIPVEVNLGVSGMERLVREVRAAERRRKHEEATAREAAAQALRGELNGTLTTLLLNCELALETSGLPGEATGRIASIHDAAQKLRTQLVASASAGE
ncbi:MAG: hypothetical protein WBV36_22355 [Terriglobales bacterium]|jgi:hypothetical protein